MPTVAFPILFIAMQIRCWKRVRVRKTQSQTTAVNMYVLGGGRYPGCWCKWRGCDPVWQDVL
mgnify:CR=1 FL=1